MKSISEMNVELDESLFRDNSFSFPSNIFLGVSNTLLLGVSYKNSFFEVSGVVQISEKYSVGEDRYSFAAENSHTGEKYSWEISALLKQSLGRRNTCFLSAMLNERDFLVNNRMELVNNVCSGLLNVKSKIRESLWC